MEIYAGREKIATKKSPEQKTSQQTFRNDGKFAKIISDFGNSFTTYDLLGQVGN